MTNKVNNCEGCHGQRVCTIVYVFDDNNECPCGTCVVKMMRCSGCEEYTEFRKKDYKHSGRLRLNHLHSFSYKKLKPIKDVKNGTL